MRQRARFWNGVLLSVCVGVAGWLLAVLTDVAMREIASPTVAFASGMALSLATGPVAILTFSKVSGIPWRRPPRGP